MTDADRRLLAMLERADVFADDWRPLSDAELEQWARIKIRTLPARTVRLLAGMDGWL